MRPFSITATEAPRAEIRLRTTGPLTLRWKIGRKDEKNQCKGWPSPPGDPHSFHSFSQFQMPAVTLFGKRNPS
jgi:hypothetical protein